MSMSLQRMPILCFLFTLLLTACNPAPTRLKSPDGTIQVEVSVNDRDELLYAVWVDDEMLLRPSSVGLSFESQNPFGSDISLSMEDRQQVDESWAPLWGKTTAASNQYNQYLFKVSDRESERFMHLIVRIFDDGVAFRYAFPEAGGFGHFRLTEERTTFVLPPETRVWATDHGHYYSSQEHPYDERLVSGIRDDELIGCPVLAESPEGTWFALTEADLSDWAGMYFRKESSEGTMLRTDLAALKRDPAVRVEGEPDCMSPWRVIMIGRDPGDLIESMLIANLNDPVEYEDTDWIRPGASAWDRWWSGDYAPGADFDPGMNTATMKYFIDLAADMDWPYMIVDWTWYGDVFSDAQNTPHPDADITTPAKDVDIREIIDYARDRDVGIILWVLSAHIDRQMDEALALYEEWGVAGIKVDFMDCDDQDMVNWYHQLARKAAEHHLVIDFHGAYKPTGVSRTLPNMLTREGVLGNEYTKWSDQITPRHSVVLPYTRGLLGEMDFTPGGFHHVHHDYFEIVGGDAPNPYVMGTRCHQLAMLVVYESAFTVICDSPHNYRDQPGADFLKGIPTTWDESRWLGGYPGEYIVMARRSGDTWYVGAMSNEDARQISLNLNFLREGSSYEAKLWKDVGDGRTHPEAVETEQLHALSGDRVDLDLAEGGGFVMILKPAG